jgi:hypothetical protein
MSATSVDTLYFQWQKSSAYPVFIKLPKNMLEGRLEKLLTDLGFQEVTIQEQKKISVQRRGTKIISLSRASSRVSQQVMLSDSLDRFGHEVLSYRGEAHVYTYRKIGMMVFSHTTSFWEIGIASQLENTEELMGLRVMLNRALSWALAPLGIIGFWGVVTAEGFVAMKQSQSFGEAVFVDTDTETVFSSAGKSKMESGFTIFRADKSGVSGKLLGPEELISFLSTSNTYLSHLNLPHTLKRAAMKLGTSVKGVWSGYSTQSEGLSKA